MLVVSLIIRNEETVDERQKNFLTLAEIENFLWGVARSSGCHWYFTGCLNGRQGQADRCDAADHKESTDMAIRDCSRPLEGQSNALANTNA